MREPLPGQTGKAGSGQGRSVPRLETTPAPLGKSPREAGPAPGLREEAAAGDSAISRGLRGSGSRAGDMSYVMGGALRPGETEVA